MPQNLCGAAFLCPQDSHAITGRFAAAPESGNETSWMLYSSFGQIFFRPEVAGAVGMEGESFDNSRTKSDTA
jgi:hypothetical protein